MEKDHRKRAFTANRLTRMSHQLRRSKSTIHVNSVSGEPYAVKAARTVREGGVDAPSALGSLLHLSLGFIRG
jgi:hypothetical protein